MSVPGDGRGNADDRGGRRRRAGRWRGALARPDILPFRSRTGQSGSLVVDGPALRDGGDFSLAPPSDDRSGGAGAEVLPRANGQQSVGSGCR